MCDDKTTTTQHTQQHTFACFDTHYYQLSRWLHLVKHVSHRTYVYVELTTSIVLYVPWNVNQDWGQSFGNVFWNLVGEEIPDHLSQQYRTRYMTTTILVEWTWGLRVYDIRDTSWKTTPSPSSLWYSFKRSHRSIGYLNIPQPLDDYNSVVRLIFLHVYDSRTTSSKSTPSPSSLYWLVHTCTKDTHPNPHVHVSFLPNIYCSFYTSIETLMETRILCKYSMLLVKHTHHTHQKGLHPPHHTPHYHIHTGPLVSCVSDQLGLVTRFYFWKVSRLIENLTVECTFPDLSIRVDVLYDISSTFKTRNTNIVLWRGPN
jgi:hypothetical protein